MRFRKARLKDAKGIAEVLTKSYNIKNIKEGMDVFRYEAKKFHNYLVAEENGRIIGLVTWIVHGLPKHQLCELDRIAVLPEYRGKGVSRKLFDALVKDAKQFYKKNKSKLRKLYLLTPADNIRAHRFYEKLGFKPRVSFEEGMKELIKWSDKEKAVDMVDKATGELKEKGLLKDVER